MFENSMNSVTEPVVSVLMTSYNREKYIASAIESVQASSFTDFELIIVDDGSADATVNIARKYADSDPRIQVYINEKNLGDYKNRNRAASFARGKFLKYIDADDYIYPWGLELMVEMMRKFPDAGWGLCSLDQDEEVPFPFQLSPRDAFEYSYFGPGLFHKSPLSAIINREVFKSVGGFSGKQHLGDFELWHMLAKKFPVVLMPHGIVWHRVHAEQQSKDNRDDPKVFFKYSVSALHFFQTAKGIPLSEDRINAICNRLKFQIKRDILNRIRRFDFSDALKMRSMVSDLNYNFITGEGKN